MTAPQADATGSPYGTAQDWATIISGVGQGASGAMQGNTINASSRKEKREAKRRTLANLVSQAMKRNQGLFRVGQENADEMNDFQSQAVQQVARGFVNALQGSTG